MKSATGVNGQCQGRRIGRIAILWSQKNTPQLRRVGTTDKRSPSAWVHSADDDALARGKLGRLLRLHNGRRLGGHDIGSEIERTGRDSDGGDQNRSRQADSNDLKMGAAIGG